MIHANTHSYEVMHCRVAVAIVLCELGFVGLGRYTEILLSGPHLV